MGIFDSGEMRSVFGGGWNRTGLSKPVQRNVALCISSAMPAFELSLAKLFARLPDAILDLVRAGIAG
jgi:hypothetical protein